MDIYSIASLVLLSLVSQIPPSHGVARNGSTGTPMFPAILAFGDSIMDTGNNNGLSTTIKCNFPPYGQDFVGQMATGRFTNGRTPGDLLASVAGIKEYLPPYLGPELKEEELLTGVSFASGGSGYDPVTAGAASTIAIQDQLDLFNEYKQKVKAIVGEDKGAALLSGSLYVLCAGTCDISNNYFGTDLRRANYDIVSYVELLANFSAGIVEELANQGARRIALVGMPPIGCVPSQLPVTGDCEPIRNQAAVQFNGMMIAALRGLGNKFPGRKFVFVDIYSSLLDMIQNPTLYGFADATRGCCGTGRVEVAVLCNPSTVTCPDDTKYLFWDSYHPTERAYQFLVDDIVKRYLRDLV